MQTPFMPSALCMQPKGHTERGGVQRRGLEGAHQWGARGVGKGREQGCRNRVLFVLSHASNTIHERCVVYVLFCLYLSYFTLIANLLC